MKLCSQLSIFLFILSTVFAYASTDDNYTFRKTKWGMSMAEVKSSEAIEPSHATEEILGYNTIVLDKNVFLIYIFSGNKLIRCKYILAQDHSNKTDFIQDYADFKKILAEKYGKPKQDEVIWKDNLYRKEPSQWGMAVATGRLVYFSVWETSESKIICLLQGDNFEIKCIVEYSSKDSSQLENKIQRQNQMDKF